MLSVQVLTVSALKTEKPESMFFIFCSTALNWQIQSLFRSDEISNSNQIKYINYAVTIHVGFCTEWRSCTHHINNCKEVKNIKFSVSIYISAFITYVVFLDHRL